MNRWEYNIPAEGRDMLIHPRIELINQRTRNTPWGQITDDVSLDISLKAPLYLDSTMECVMRIEGGFLRIIVRDADDSQVPENRREVSP